MSERMGQVTAEERGGEMWHTGCHLEYLNALIAKILHAVQIMYINILVQYLTAFPGCIVCLVVPSNTTGFELFAIQYTPDIDLLVRGQLLNYVAVST